MNIIHRLKSKYSEPYRIRNGWGLRPIRNKREEKALVEFCRNELKEEYIGLNPKTKEVYEHTLMYYDKYGYLDMQYVEDNAGRYWT